jgi:hypothetical protein
VTIDLVFQNYFNYPFLVNVRESAWHLHVFLCKPFLHCPHSVAPTQRFIQKTYFFPVQAKGHAIAVAAQFKLFFAVCFKKRASNAGHK